MATVQSQTLSDILAARFALCLPVRLLSLNSERNKESQHNFRPGRDVGSHVVHTPLSPEDEAQAQIEGRVPAPRVVKWQMRAITRRSGPVLTPVVIQLSASS